MTNEERVLEFLKESRCHDGHSSVQISEATALSVADVEKALRGLGRKVSGDTCSVGDCTTRVWKYAFPQPGLVGRQIANVEKEIAEWPEWMKREAGFIQRHGQ